MGGQERKNYARWDEFSGVNTSNQLGEGVKKKCWQTRSIGGDVLVL